MMYHGTIETGSCLDWGDWREARIPVPEVSWINHLGMSTKGGDGTV